MQYDGEDIVHAGSSDYSVLTFDWALIDVCNYKCSYCNAGYGSDIHRPVSRFFKTPAQIQAWRQVLDRLKLNSIPQFEISLVGGEPTLHPHLLDIIEQLCLMDKATEIQLLTNLSKPHAYFEQFNRPNFEKLIVNPSIHFEMYNEQLLDKCIALNKLEHINLEVGVMLHDDKKYWKDIEHTFKVLISNKLHYYVQYIEPYYDSNPAYTDEFYSRFNGYISQATDHPLYEFRSEHNTYNLSQTEINKHSLNKFKGWKCRQLCWKIDHAGKMIQACTGTMLNILGKNIHEDVICPHDCCACDMWWDYKKVKL